MIENSWGRRQTTEQNNSRRVAHARGNTTSLLGAHATRGFAPRASDLPRIIMLKLFAFFPADFLAKERHIPRIAHIRERLALAMFIFLHNFQHCWAINRILSEAFSSTALIKCQHLLSL